MRSINRGALNVQHGGLEYKNSTDFTLKIKDREARCRSSKEASQGIIQVNRYKLHWHGCMLEVLPQQSNPICKMHSILLRLQALLFSPTKSGPYSRIL